MLKVLSSPFQLQRIASVRERPLRATLATTAVPTLPAAAVREPTLLFVSESPFSLAKSALEAADFYECCKNQRPVLLCTIPKLSTAWKFA